jgi:hypothetical protein
LQMLWILLLSRLLLLQLVLSLNISLEWIITCSGDVPRTFSENQFTETTTEPLIFISNYTK